MKYKNKADNDLSGLISGLTRKTELCRIDWRKTPSGYGASINNFTLELSSDYVTSGYSRISFKVRDRSNKGVALIRRDSCSPINSELERLFNSVAKFEKGVPAESDASLIKSVYHAVLGI